MMCWCIVDGIVGNVLVSVVCSVSVLFLVCLIRLWNRFFSVVFVVIWFCGVGLGVLCIILVEEILRDVGVGSLFFVYVFVRSRWWKGFRCFWLEVSLIVFVIVLRKVLFCFLWFFLVMCVVFSVDVSNLVSGFNLGVFFFVV